MSPRPKRACERIRRLSERGLLNFQHLLIFTGDFSSVDRRISLRSSVEKTRFVFANEYFCHAESVSVVRQPMETETDEVSRNQYFFRY